MSTTGVCHEYNRSMSWVQQEYVMSTTGVCHEYNRSMSWVQQEYVMSTTGVCHEYNRIMSWVQQEYVMSTTGVCHEYNYIYNYIVIIHWQYKVQHTIYRKYIFMFRLQYLRSGKSKGILNTLHNHHLKWEELYTCVLHQQITSRQFSGVRRKLTHRWEYPLQK